MRLAIAGMLALALTACAEAGTGGRSVVFEVAIEPPAALTRGEAFVTSTGWEVELQEAYVAIGPFYLFEDAPALADRRDDGFDLLSWAGGLFVRTAHAHPGDVHYNGGLLRGEYIGQVAFDLHAGETLSLGVARGIAGEVRAVTVILDPPGATTVGDAAALQGHHAWVRGVARRGREVVEFEGGLDLGAELVERQVDGVSIDIELDDGGTLVIGARPQQWFDEADFSTLDVMAESGRMEITPDGQVAIAWALGLRTPRAFFARWTDDESFPPLED